MMETTVEQSFDTNWKVTEEALYTHWTYGEPSNQIQLAFRKHWEVFQELMRSPHFNQGKRCLEVGCGRGSISSYFSNSGFYCVLLDISYHVLTLARNIFNRHSLPASFSVGDAYRLQFLNNSFDVVVSIGLLEHFEDVDKIVEEQVRVLDKGGLFLGYVVPKYEHNIQKDYEWIVEILKIYVNNQKKPIEKIPVYRSDNNSSHYIPLLKKYGLKNVQASGIYPLPMISNSIEFPFTLMHPEAEKILVSSFETMLEERSQKSVIHPWLCKEGYGQAFLLWGYK